MTETIAEQIEEAKETGMRRWDSFLLLAMSRLTVGSIVGSGEPVAHNSLKPGINVESNI
jgi:hypothetical protein